MSKTKPRILVVGSANTDMVIRLDRLPKAGETLLGGRFTIAAGGKGANQAVAAARAGGDVVLVGRVGADMFGAETLPRLARDGIDTRRIARDVKAPSGVALIFVSKNGENSIAVAPGANGCLCPADIRRSGEEFVRAAVMVVQLETPLAAVREAIALAAANRVPVILNPAPARTLPAALLRKVSVITPNETEAERLTGITVSDEATAAEAAMILRRRGVGTVIITLGSRGAFVATGDQTRLVPSFPVKAVDTTAAGDVFTGALAVALAEGKPILDAVRFACAAAAISVTRSGAQPSVPKRREIEGLLAKHHGQRAASLVRRRRTDFPQTR